MQNSTPRKTNRHSNSRRMRRNWKRFSAVASCLVVLATLSALTLPAITANRTYICGKEEHTHTGDCYTTATVLDCTYDTLNVHTHADECYLDGALCCGQADFLFHEHDKACFDENNKLICSLEEIKPHTHEDKCYAPVVVPSETAAPSTEAAPSEEPAPQAQEPVLHSHGDSCYGWVRSADAQCGTEASEGHTHGDECKDAEGNMTCELSESAGHTHTDDCYPLVVSAEPTCGIAEGEPEPTEAPATEAAPQAETDPAPDQDVPMVTTGEMERICGKEELFEHAHTGSCEARDKDGNLTHYTCGQGETAFHQHGAECPVREVETTACGKEAHVHTIECIDTSMLTPEQKQAVIDLTAVIDELPSPEALRMEFGMLAGDKTAQEEYMALRGASVKSTLDVYNSFTPAQQDAVLNSAKLLELKEVLGLTDGMSPEAKQQVEDLILLIEALPEAQEVQDQLAHLQTEGTPEELAAYKEKVTAQVSSAYELYEAMTPEQQNLVTNAQRLLDLKFLIEEKPLEGDTFESTSADGSISVSVTLDMPIPDTAEFNVVPMDESTGTYQQSYGDVYDALMGLGANINDLMVLDMHFSDESGIALASVGEAEVTLTFETPILAGEGSIFAFHITENGAENVTRSVVRDAQGVHQITIRTDGFSPFALTNATPTKSLRVHAVNTVDTTNNAVMLMHKNAGVRISDMTTETFVNYCALVVETEHDKLTLKAIYDVGESKSNLYASGNGFIILYDPLKVGDLSFSVGQELAAATTLWKVDTAMAFNASGHGTITLAFNKPVKNNTSKLHPIQTADTAAFIEVNLYDYGNNINNLYNSNKAYPGFQQEYGSRDVGTTLNRWASFNFGNNVTMDAKAGNYNLTNKGGTINTTTDGANAPITGAIKNQLGADGYPVLADNNASLKYLFSQNTYATKMNNKSINGLFQYDPVTGAYSYNSRENHAQFNQGSDTFTVYEERITPNYLMYPFGNFLPFNDITQLSQQATLMTKNYFGELADSARSRGVYNGYGGYTDIYNTLGNELDSFVGLMNAYKSNWQPVDAVNAYFEKSNLPKTFTAAEISDLYNIDYDEPSNFFFGMDMKMNLMQPKDGLTGQDGQQKMYFYFTGDDDVWVFIDGKLTLDLSGIHRHVGGAIDFQNGAVLYFKLDPQIGDVGTTLADSYKVVYFEEIFPADMLVTAEGEKRANGSTVQRFKDYSEHEFKFYYMERGAGSSICRMNFNFPVLRQNSISVTKEVTVDGQVAQLLGDPDFSFQVLKADSDELFIAPNTTFDILNRNNEKIGTGRTDSNGVFTIKANQIAVFSGIEENAGSYRVRELLDPDVAALYGTIQVDGSSNTTNYDVTVGSDTFVGVISPVKDVSNGSTIFTFNNRATTNKLSSLNITKEVTAQEVADPDAVFDFYVTLDGAALPVGTVYTVGEETRTVTTEGIMSVKHGQTAKVEHILSGTVFTVQETAASALGYSPSYSGTNITQASNENGPYVYGTILTDTAVEVRIENRENGVSLTVPVLKTLLNPNQDAHSFHFHLTQVTDSTGATAVTDGVSLAADIPLAAAAGSGQNQFRLMYLEREIDTFPATYYYAVTELARDAQKWIYDFDETLYVVQVTVDKSETGELTAAITDIWRNGTSIGAEGAISFTNSLLADLTISKTVLGKPVDTLFTFEVRMDLTEGGTPVSGTYPTLDQDGVEGTVTFTDGKATLQLGSGKRLTIRGLPAGSVWSITETVGHGYVPSFQVDSNGVVQGDTASGTLASSGASVAFTNTPHYELPDTGGMGTLPYLFSGLALLGACWLIYDKKSRHANREESR